MNERFISVDVETSGPIPGIYSLLAIGACDVDEPGQGFSCLLKPISEKADPEALAVSGLLLAELERAGLPPAEAMTSFSDWLKSVKKADENLVFVGFNASFDWSFINYYFHCYLGHNPFGFSALDIKSYFMGARSSSWRETRSSQMDLSLNPELRATHNALEDARYQAELFRLARKSHTLRDGSLGTG